MKSILRPWIYTHTHTHTASISSYIQHRDPARGCIYAEVLDVRITMAQSQTVTNWSECLMKAVSCCASGINSRLNGDKYYNFVKKSGKVNSNFEFPMHFYVSVTVFTFTSTSLRLKSKRNINMHKHVGFLRCISLNIDHFGKDFTFKLTGPEFSLHTIFLYNMTFLQIL